MDTSNEHTLFLSYFSVLKRLSVNTKLKLITALSESIYSEISDENQEDESWRELAGAWKDMDETLANNITKMRFDG